MPADFLKALPGLFDRNGLFVPRKLKDSAEAVEDLYEKLSRSPYRELRYLGLSGLMLLDREKHAPLFWEAFYDSFYPVRRVFVENWDSAERNRLFNEIFKKLTGDPRQVIRETAYRRIKKDFADLFSFRINNFSPDEQYRLIMFLESDTAHDQALLADFIEADDDALASRALYRIQKEEGTNQNTWPERTRKLKLLRFSSLFAFCHGSQDCFPAAFELIDEHTPPGLASQYIMELIRRPFNEAWKDFYGKAVRMIGEMKGPRSAVLLEHLYKNRNLWQKIGRNISPAFTTRNQYYTANLLKKILKEKRDSFSETDLAGAAEKFTFPL